MTEIMPVPRKIILLSYQQGAKVVLFSFLLMFNIKERVVKSIPTNLKVPIGSL